MILSETSRCSRTSSRVQHRGQQPRVDIAAGEDQPDLLAAETLGIGQQRGQGGRAGALGDGLLDIAVEGDGPLEEGLLDQQHVVDQRPGDGEGEVADLLDLDALGDGLAAGRRRCGRACGR